MCCFRIIQLNAKKSSPFIIPALVGAFILAGSLIVFFQLSSYQAQIIESNKDDYIKVIENTISRREGRVHTISSGIIGLYGSSEHVSSVEFDGFAQTILGSNSEILNLFVLDGSTIVESYPIKEYVGHDFDSLFPDYPTVVAGQKAMTAEFAINETASLVIAVPFGYFIPEGTIISEQYKLVLLSPIDDNAVLYSVARSGGASESVVEFLQKEKDNAITVEYKTNLFGHKLKKYYDLRYVLWDASFEAQSYEQTIILVAGVVLSFVIPVLLVRTNLLRASLQEKSEALERANEELKKVEKSKDEFVTMIVHDLKNPLLPIKAYSEILLSQKMGQLNEEQAKRLRSISASAITLQKMIQDLLDANKLNLGKLKLDIQEGSLSELARRTVSELEPEFRKKGVAVSLELQDISCRFDSMRMGQVFQNILLNALDFVPDKTGKIHISLKSEGGNAVITIADNGIGIPKDKIDGLFAKFYQVSTDKNRRYGGSGLGLSVCKGIVEGHGGMIWAESDGEGKGTTMHIMIPLAGKSA